MMEKDVTPQELSAFTGKTPPESPSQANNLKPSHHCGILDFCMDIDYILKRGLSSFSC